MRALVAAHAADLLTFTLAIALFRIPIGAELNPTMVSAYLAGGLLGVTLWKGALAAGLVFLVRRIRTRSRRPGVLLGYTFGLVGAASNVVTILHIGRLSG